MPHNNRITVLNPGDDRIALMVEPNKAERMVLCGQARKIPGRPRMLRLLGIGEPWACRTRTARGGPLASMGRSQVYTTVNSRRTVDGFKYLAPEDMPIFYSAVLENVA